MKNLKKTLCLFLALVMCLGMLPMSVLADEVTEPEQTVTETEQTPAEEVTPAEEEEPAEEVTPAEEEEPAEEETPAEEEEPAEAEMPAIQVSETFNDQGITVEVSAPEGAFPVGTTVSIEPVPEIPMAFDITFRNEDGEELQPANGLSVDVNFSIPNFAKEMGLESATVEVVRIDDVENKESETLSTQEITADDGDTVEVTAEAEHFTVYGVKLAAAKAGGDSYGTDGAALLAAMQNLRTANVTRSAYESFYPETNTYNVCWGWDAENGYGAVEFTDEDAAGATATDVVWTTYYDSHFLGEPKGYKWITASSSNPDVAWADVEVIPVEGKQALKVTIHRGSGGGRAIIEIGFTVTEMDVLAGIAWDYQTYSDTNGYLYYIVDNEGTETEPDVPAFTADNQVHEVYMPVNSEITIKGIIAAMYPWSGGVIGYLGNSPIKLNAGWYNTKIMKGDEKNPNPSIAAITYSSTEGDRDEGYYVTIKSGQQAGTTILSMVYNSRIAVSVNGRVYATSKGYDGVTDQFLVHVYDPETVEIPVGTTKDFQYPEVPISDFEPNKTWNAAPGAGTFQTPKLVKGPQVNNSSAFQLTNKTNLSEGRMKVEVKALSAADDGIVTAIADYATAKQVVVDDYNGYKYGYASRTIYSYKVNVKSVDNSQWTLTFDENAGSDTVTKMPNPNPVTGTFEEGKTEVTVKLPTNSPEREGYTFQGWSLDPNVAKGQYQPGDEIIIKNTDPDVTLYAIWSKNPTEDEKPPKNVIDEALKDLKVVVSCGTEANHTTPAASKTMNSALKVTANPIEHYDPVSKVYTLIYTADYTDYSADYEQFVKTNGGPNDLTHRLVDAKNNSTDEARLSFKKNDQGVWEHVASSAYFAVTCGEAPEVGKVTVTKTRYNPTGSTLNLSAATNYTINYQIAVANATEDDWTGKLTGGIVESAGGVLTNRNVVLSPVADSYGHMITLTGDTTSVFTVKAGATVTLFLSYTAVDGDVGKTLFNEVKSAEPNTNPVVEIKNNDSGIKITNTYEYTLKYDLNDGTSSTPYKTVTQTSNAASAVFQVGKELNEGNWTVFTNPQRDGWTFLGWAESASATTAMTDTELTLTSTSPAKTLYAVWQVPELTEGDLPPILGGIVRVHCKHAETHVDEAMPYGLIPNSEGKKDSYDAAITRVSNNSFSVSLTVHPQKYVEMFNAVTGYDHAVPADMAQTVLLTKGNDGTWTVTKSQKTKTVDNTRASAGFVFDFEVDCGGKPIGSGINDGTIRTILNGTVELICTNDNFIVGGTQTHKHSDYTMDSYTLSNIVQTGNKATATLTVTAGSYLTLFNTEFASYTHVVSGEDTKAVNLSLTFTPNADKTGGTWAVDNAVKVTFSVVCTTYNLTYNANGGAGAPVDNTDYNAGSTVTLDSTTIPTYKDGETDLVFKGWSETQLPVYDSDATIPADVLVTTVTVNGDKTVYAVWQQPGNTLYKLTYDANGGNESSVPAASENLPAGSHALVTTPAPTHADVDGKAVEFIGWTETKTEGIYAADATAPVTITSVTIGDHDVTVYAAWRYVSSTEPSGTHTVTWMDGYNNTQIAQVAVKDGETDPAADSQTAPTHSGWTFSRWETARDTSGNITYTAIYTQDGNSGSSGNGGSSGSTPTPPVDIEDEDPPLANVDGNLNTTDHFAYIIGRGEDCVQPLENITRAEVATIFFRLLTEEYRVANWSTVSSFPDVEAGAWYSTEIATAEKAGILKGCDDGNMQPNRNITRAEFTVMAIRFLNGTIEDDGIGDFADTANHWAAKEIRLAAKAGWIKGYGNEFRPNDPITRAEAMTIINRMLDRVPGETFPAGTIEWGDNPTDAWYYADVMEATNGHDYEREEGSMVEKWTAITPYRDWIALEAEWTANNGASAPASEEK